MKHDHDQFLELKERMAERIAIDSSAVLAREGRPDVEVRISDISVAGFRCRTPERLEIGSEVTLTVRDVGAFPAVIAWQLGEEAGASFCSGLPWRTVFAALLKAIGMRR